MCFMTGSTFLVTVFLQLFACGSPGTFFKFGEQGCHTPRDLYLSNLVFLFSAGTDIACDVFLIFIPMPLLWKLQVTQRQKVILAAIFLLPLIPITFGILRLVFCNPTTGTVNVIKFTFYFMLENTAGKSETKVELSLLNQHSHHDCMPSFHAAVLPAKVRQHNSTDSTLCRRPPSIWQEPVSIQQQVLPKRSQRCYTPE
jgi:hypothetical protein